ncbi:MFS transporter [Saccharobesus litoralis]|uniref:MFS transporter n=1 Tax=Saccharobesus litoralis TaxID=2172099 RepID=A0A2S0VPZ8_9ALTE|nr:sugar efflux transporter [Saccharobesus litoralis]AWB66160.1 MFS transporter [Saccharobesus litoralis]
MLFISTSSQPHHLSAKQFIFLSSLTGMIGSFIYPLLSYFLIDELNNPPIYVGIYMVSVTLAGIVISQTLGKLADKGVSARKMYLLANSGIVLALLIYMNTHSFWVVLAAGIFCMAFGNASIPLMLTLGRQWANKQTIDITQFNAQLRAGISFAWMMGPPLGFALVASIGFVGAFSSAIMVALLSMAFVWLKLPELSQQKSKHKNEATTPAPLHFWFLAIAVVAGSMGNNMYSSSLALYTIKELSLPEYTPGILMGLVAGLEVPIMLWANRLCQRFSKINVMLVAFGFGFVFYAGMYVATEFWQMLALQFINAVFYGLFAGVGLTLLQAQLPNRVGFTSAVYSNGFKVGVMLGSSGMGVIAQYSSFRLALVGAMLSSVLGLLFLVLYNWQQNKAIAD